VWGEKTTILSKLLPQPGSANAVDFWAGVMAAGPVVAGVGMLAIGGLLGAFADFQLVDKPVNFIQGLTILGTMCFPFAVFFEARRRWNAAQARASLAWPTVPGKVERSGSQRTYGIYGTAFCRLTLSYRYEVDGREYEGDMAQFGPPRVTNRDLIEGLVAKYPAGAAVTVHYNPDAPEIAVLETSDEMAWQNAWQVWFLFGVPIVFSLIAAVVNAQP
jgi:hypothetical protein